MRKELTRIIGNEFCRLEVELTTGRLSICGTAGTIETHLRTHLSALEFWTSYFEEDPSSIREMNVRCGTNFRSPKKAAQYVLDTDGVYHGIDVIRETDKSVYIAHSCGQIKDEISRFFPEVIPYLQWHLNDMRAGCEHQEALGWNADKNLSQPCPECGYKYGTEWKGRGLPTSVIEWFDGLLTDADMSST